MRNTFIAQVLYILHNLPHIAPLSTHCITGVYVMHRNGELSIHNTSRESLMIDSVSCAVCKQPLCDVNNGLL